MTPKKSINEMTQEEQAEEGARQMVEFMTSCPGKSAISGVTGFGLGGVFGLFMASVSISLSDPIVCRLVLTTLCRWLTMCPSVTLRVTFPIFLLNNR